MNPPSEQYRAGTAYITVTPGRNRYELRVVKATSRKPMATPEGSVVIKVQLHVPRKAFEPLEPEAIVTVPEELVQHVVNVEAVEQ